MLKGSMFLYLFCSSRMGVTPVSAQVMHSLPWLVHRNKWQTEAKSASIHLVSHLKLFCLPRCYSTVFCTRNLVCLAVVGRTQETLGIVAFMVQYPKYKWSSADVFISILILLNCHTAGFTCSPVCILHKSFLPLRIFGTLFMVRSTLNIQKVKIYHKKLNISDTELIARTDLNSMYWRLYAFATLGNYIFVCLTFLSQVVGLNWFNSLLALKGK